MNETFRLGRIRGIPIGVNWSVVVILGVLTWSLAAGYLPRTEPGYRPIEYWMVGVAAAVVFLASLLAHEMGHALVAIRSGVAVHGITLWLFGGVSKLDAEATTPQDELRIAVTGPAVSLAIAALAGAGAAATHALGAPGLLVAALAWLATINVVLGVFNLMPAAPLDGGRVLRALLWRHRGDHLSATISASNAGRVFGMVLIGLGVLQAAAGAAGAGLWMAFLGWFLLSAARAEQTHAVLVEALADVPVRRIMGSPPITVSEDLTLQRLVDEVVMEHHCSSFPTTDATGAVTGLVTLSRVRSVPRDRRSTTTVRQIATPLADVVQVRPQDPTPDLLTRLAASGDGRALVFDEGQLVGIVSPTDVVRMSDLALMGATR
jgi:Zn-dependent protease/CBS domain-containing protein